MEWYVAWRRPSQRRFICTTHRNETDPCELLKTTLNTLHIQWLPLQPQTKKLVETWRGKRFKKKRTNGHSEHFQRLSDIPHPYTAVTVASNQRARGSWVPYTAQCPPLRSWHGAPILKAGHAILHSEDAHHTIVTGNCDVHNPCSTACLCANVCNTYVMCVVTYIYMYMLCICEYVS